MHDNTFMLCQLFAVVSVYDGRLPVFLFLLPLSQMDFEYCYESDDADYEMSPLSDSWVGGDGKPICPPHIRAGGRNIFLGAGKDLQEWVKVGALAIHFVYKLLIWWW